MLLDFLRSSKQCSWGGGQGCVISHTVSCVSLLNMSQKHRLQVICCPALLFCHQLWIFENEYLLAWQYNQTSQFFILCVKPKKKDLNNCIQLWTITTSLFSYQSSLLLFLSISVFTLSFSIYLEKMDLGSCHLSVVLFFLVALIVTSISTFE